MNLVKKTLARFPALGEVLFRNSKIVFQTPWVFKRSVTLALICNKTKTKVAAIFPVNKHYFR